MAEHEAVPDGDVHSELLAAWRDRCRRRGVETSHVGDSSAGYLVDALVGALAVGSETPELGRCARTWGARFDSPVEALAAVTCLREVLGSLDGHVVAAGLVVADAIDGLPRVVDQLMLESVDAAAGSLRAAARVDPLTGCANRRALQEELPHAVASARRSGLPVSVAMIDLDGLKRVNDEHGHAAGDAALVALVTALRRALRGLDGLYRSGGDEFVVVSPFTAAAGSRRMLERAATLGAPAFSWGVASLDSLGPQSADDPERLLLAADADLYARRRARQRAALAAARRRRLRAAASVTATAALTATAAYGVAAVADASFPSLNVAAPPNAQGNDAGTGHAAIGRPRAGSGSGADQAGAATSAPNGATGVGAGTPASGAPASSSTSALGALQAAIAGGSPSIGTHLAIGTIGPHALTTLTGTVSGAGTSTGPGRTAGRLSRLAVAGAAGLLLPVTSGPTGGSGHGGGSGAGGGGGGGGTSGNGHARGGSTVVGTVIPTGMGFTTGNGQGMPGAGNAGSSTPPPPVTIPPPAAGTAKGGHSSSSSSSSPGNSGNAPGHGGTGGGATSHHSAKALGASVRRNGNHA
jgi:diguanylate cyclase (GGDEF)-like protein